MIMGSLWQAAMPTITATPRILVMIGLKDEIKSYCNTHSEHFFDGSLANITP